MWMKKNSASYRKKATSSSSTMRRLEGTSVGRARVSCRGELHENRWRVGARNDPRMLPAPAGKGEYPPLCLISGTDTPAYFLIRITSRIASGRMDFPISTCRLVGRCRRGSRGFEPGGLCCDWGRTSMRREGLWANR